MDRFHCGFEVKLADGAADGTFAGYGATFDNVDWYGDTIRKGAFKDTLREWKRRGKWPKMLSQHGGWGMGADDMTPIGQWTAMAEDDVGLRCEGRLFALDTDASKLRLEGIKSGELDGLSIGYDPVKWEMGTKPEDPRRTLTRINLWEVSVVTFGANPAALVDEVKAIEAIDAINSLSDFERFLREAGHLSRKSALALTSRTKAIALREAAAAGDLSDLLAALRAAKKLITS